MTDTHATENVGFATLVLSLVNNAAILLGDVPDPTTGQPTTPDIEAASYMIDLLGMLEEKTRGNLTAAEDQLLRQALYDLRLRYVEVRDRAVPKDEPRIIIP